MLRYLQQARTVNSRTDAAFRTLASTVGGRRTKPSSKAGKSPAKPVNTNIIKLANLALFMKDMTEASEIHELLKECTDGSNHNHLNALGKRLETISAREGRPINQTDFSDMHTRVKAKYFNVIETLGEVQGAADTELEEHVTLAEKKISHVSKQLRALRRRARPTRR